MEVVISENNKFISLHIKQPEGVSLGWEKLQNIKDSFFSDLDFVEVYPKENQIVNNANERHLIHIKNWDCVKMEDLEVESNIKIVNID